MEISNLIPHIEALIFASDKPLTPAEITELINQAFGFMEDKVVPDQVDAAIEGIVEKYNSEFYPFEVRQSGGGWQFLTKKDFHKTVAQLNGEKFLKRLSAAALETLAIIAYKQPITKGEIEAIRGVSSDYSVQKLLEKDLIIIAGRNEKMPGHPLIYTTSKNFMDYFGINSHEDLPKIREVLADQVVEPTIVTPADFESSNLVVTNEGELLDAATGDEEANPAGDPEVPADTQPPAGEEEEHLNGHAFELEDDGEDEETEEVIEEFNADNLFIESDELEAETSEGDPVDEDSDAAIDGEEFTLDDSDDEEEPGGDDEEESDGASGERKRDE